MRRKALLAVIFLIMSQLLGLSTFLTVQKTEAASVTSSLAIAGKGNVSGTKFVDGNGKPFFMVGVNYVGSNDRAWLMWNSDKFDINLINQDFQQATGAGINTVRIFVMAALRDDIKAGNFSKLDQVINAAANNNLKLIISFNDYDESDLTKEIPLDAKVVAHYPSNATILAYDLQNEPQFNDLAADIYPTGTTVPLQTDGFIKTYGELMSQSAVDAWRQTSEGKAVVPARMDSHAGYIYANAYKYFLKFLDDSSAWVATHPGQSTLDYMDSPDSQKWQAYLKNLSDTLAAWISVRSSAIRQTDKTTPITIGWSNIVLAKLAANQNLGFVSLHRYVAIGTGGLTSIARSLDNLQKTFKNSPVVLEEFGYSNANSDGSAVSTSLTANYETALWLYLMSHGFAGGVKWMLVNFPPGYNKVENNYGLLDDKNQPKPSYYALKAISGYLQMMNQQPGGTLPNFTADGSNTIYNYTSSQAIISDGLGLHTGNIHYSQSTSSPFAVYWPNNGTGQMTFVPTQLTNIVINVDALYPNHSKNVPVTLTQDNGAAQPLSLNNGTASFTINANHVFVLNVPIQPPAFLTAKPIGGSVQYFIATGHNLGGAFLTYWKTHGGLAIFGYPISEEFTENGYTVQYFERNRFEYHPENTNTPYLVQLGLLGHDMTAGRENEAAFKPIPAFNSSSNRLYFSATGHSLNYGFKTYWEQNGGLAQFGYPISEEFSEVNPADGKTYTVQYFERARFEYHPEFKGTQYETELGLLGVQVVKAKGWL